jgi:membrane-associated protease RseP (regulator of RpoE activity)
MTQARTWATIEASEDPMTISGRRNRRTSSLHLVRRTLTVAVLATAVLLAVRTGTVGAVLVVIGILASVAIHELAHLGAARALGVKATEYFVGLGPTLWARQRGELRWGLKLLPLGGYVRLTGMDSGEEVDPAEESRTFRAQRPGTRAAISAAGPLANLALALVLFAGLGVASQGSVGDGVATGAGDTVEVLHLSTGAIVQLPATGVRLADAAVTGSEPPVEERVLSPVGATRLANQAVGAGPEFAIGLVAIINAFLALINLVPLLPFDGGYITLAAIEKSASVVSRRRVRIDARRLRPLAATVVLALLLLGAAAITLDITQPVDNPFVAAAVPG